MIILYNDIMAPIEILHNYNRLPVKASHIYEPNLIYSFVVYPNNTPEYQEYLNDQIEKSYDSVRFYMDNPEYNTNHAQIQEFLSDPISACQFHVIEVKSDF